MTFGVVVFPGSNCDEDAVYALKNILGQNVVKLWHKDSNFKNVDFIILPGGFSYGDYLRSGAIAKFSPIMDKIIEFANNGGFVLGICNGFQILCEANLLPGTLIRNENHNFICKNIFIKPQHNLTIFTENTGKKGVFKIPIAHAEGCYYANENTLQEIIDNKQIIFKYCNENGEINKSANPNGSLKNIAGICNANRNVFGMMPHPERACDPKLNNIDGKLILEGAIRIFRDMGK
ncbi:MAG: phosphoribosylformylglycinamidine synthase I [Flavobacteriales bacterium]|jgi:phosphoribosylformylglycinamidine synthase I|nr:phosphoribosylformylglycinamidine synthase I [Flavobacteriales bacterium]|tara:strand:- start:17598 stop:18299 length:702 start_codon:yes stop_codon:yes gene_type:complete